MGQLTLMGRPVLGWHDSESGELLLCGFLLALVLPGQVFLRDRTPPAGGPWVPAGTWKSTVEYRSSCPHFGQRSRRPVIITPADSVFGSATGVGNSSPQARHFTKSVGTFRSSVGGMD